MKQIVYNAIECSHCGDTVVSYHVHDFKCCSCGLASVDGGMEYERYGGDGFTKITVYADDDFEIVRKHATRGSRGKDGKQPLKYIAICDMDDDYLEAVIDYGGADWHIDLIKKEIDYRQKHIK
jgi:hypothetical protein